MELNEEDEEERENNGSAEENRNFWENQYQLLHVSIFKLLVRTCIQDFFFIFSSIVK